MHFLHHYNVKLEKPLTKEKLGRKRQSVMGNENSINAQCTWMSYTDSNQKYSILVQIKLSLKRRSVFTQFWSKFLHTWSCPTLPHLLPTSHRVLRATLPGIVTRQMNKLHHSTGGYKALQATREPWCRTKRLNSSNKVHIHVQQM